MLKKSIVLCLSLFLMACGKEQAAPASGTPGGGQKKLDSFELQQVSQASGYLGDVLYFTAHAAGTMPLEQMGSDMRDGFRDELFRTARLKRCTVSSRGDFFDDEMLVRVQGRRCRVRSSYEQTRRVTQNIGNNTTEEINYNKDFDIRNDNVSGDIQSASVRAKIVIGTQFNPDNTAINKTSDVTISGQTKTSGDYRYTLKETYQRVDPLTSNRERIRYQRTDNLNFTGGLVAVFFQDLAVVDGSTVSHRFYVNGEEITQRTYESLMQNLDKQVGLANF